MRPDADKSKIPEAELLDLDGMPYYVTNALATGMAGVKVGCFDCKKPRKRFRHGDVIKHICPTQACMNVIVKLSMDCLRKEKK